MMNHQKVIDWKLATIHKDVAIKTSPSKEMQQYISSHSELEKELAFIDAFWHQNEQEQPSSELDKRFYKMLSQAQAAQQSTDSSYLVKKPRQISILAQFGNWLSAGVVKPLAQFATLALVFVLGFNANNGSESTDSLTANVGLESLQQEVSSLSTMLALSMLEKSSAAERLTGVAYSQETDLTNPVLMSTLMSTLENDRSTAVKLAIINAFNTLPEIKAQEASLIALALSERNTLVKIELCSLLLNIGTQQARVKLLAQLEESELTPDMAEFLKKINAISHI